MGAPSASECYQTPVQARTAPGACPTGRGARLAVSWGAALVSPDRVQAVGGGVSRLLHGMRRDDPALYEHGM